MPFDFFENQLVPHRRKVEAHCCVVDEGLGNVAEVHFLEQLCGMGVVRGVHDFAPILVFGLGALAVGRSALQVSAMSIFSASSRAATLERASMLDPGSYRIHLRLAQAYADRGSCTRARPHARAARSLFPNAAEPRRYLGMCDGR